MPILLLAIGVLGVILRTMDDAPGIASTSLSFNSAEIRVFASGLRVALKSPASSWGEAMVPDDRLARDATTSVKGKSGLTVT